MYLLKISMTVFRNVLHVCAEELGHFINNARYFFYLHVYFILGSISLQSFYVVPLLPNDRVPAFRKICYSI
jgi:hypothetical protein